MTLPESTNESSAAYGATLAAARAVAISSCVFCLVVAALIVINHYRVKAADPVNSEALTALIAEVSKRPADDDLKADVRTFDLLARKAFYTSQRFAIVGAYLLAGLPRPAGCI